MRISTLKGKISEVDVIVPGNKEAGEEDEVVHIKYRPGALTLEVFDQVQEQIAQGLEMKTAVTVLEPVLIEWDLQDDVLDENGEPTGEVVQLPCNEAGIKKVPISFLGRVMEAITEDAKPTPTNAGSSGATSVQTGSSEESPNGTSSSEEPSTWAARPGS